MSEQEKHQLKELSSDMPDDIRFVCCRDRLGWNSDRLQVGNDLWAFVEPSRGEQSLGSDSEEKSLEPIQKYLVLCMKLAPQLLKENEALRKQLKENV